MKFSKKAFFQSPPLQDESGANPAICIYNATSNLARFKNKNDFFYFEKRSSLLQLCRFVVVNSKVAGLATAFGDVGKIIDDEDDNNKNTFVQKYFKVHYHSILPKNLFKFVKFVSSSRSTLMFRVLFNLGRFILFVETNLTVYSAWIFQTIVSEYLRCCKSF
jgi:hypothetical protein